MGLAHLKTDCFLANAALFQCAVLAYNTLRWMALMSANATLQRWEPQTVRTFLIRVAGKPLTGANPLRIKLPQHHFHPKVRPPDLWDFDRGSPCSGCETGHPSRPFALRSATVFVPRYAPLRRWLDCVSDVRLGCACIWPASAAGPSAPSPLRPYAYRGLPASCFALPWRAADDLSFKKFG